MKKILIVSRDPGGTNAVFPLVSVLEKKYEILVAAKDVALDLYINHNIEVNYIINQTDKSEVSRILDDCMPSLVITGTSSDDKIEALFWKECEVREIISFAIIDHWVSYGIRFSKYKSSEIEEYKKNRTHSYIPTKILSMDNYSKKMIMNENIPSERIEVTGQPYFKWIKDHYKNSVKRNSCKNQVYRILYISEPYEKVYGGRKKAKRILGYSEKTIFEELQIVLNQIVKDTNHRIELAVKLHPKEDCNSYDSYMGNEGVCVKYESEKDAYKILDNYDLICGMTSMLLIESYIFEKNVMSIRLNEKGEEFILEKKGLISSIRNKDDLHKQVLKHISGRVENRDDKDELCNDDVYNNIMHLVERYI